MLAAGPVRAAASDPSSELSNVPPAPQAAQPPLVTLASISLEPGEIRSLAVEGVSRVAVGDPKILDVSVVSSNELLLQAKAIGMTNLLLWDHRGQSSSKVEVVDHAPQLMEAQLTELIQQLHLTQIHVDRKNGRLFLMGEVGKQEDLDQLEQMLGGFPAVINLVRVGAMPAPPTPPSPPLVSLTVQVIEMSRKDLEKLGVKWSESISLTEPQVTDQTFADSLFKWGTSLTRSSIAQSLNALVQKNRARLLAEPKLVTASGKEAKSFIGVEVPVLKATTASTNGDAVTASIDFRETGVLLTMTPVVLDNRRVTTTIKAEVSSIDTSSGLTVPVGSQTILVPGFAVRRANTEVTTASAETIIIAGLLESQDTNALSQVPALGSVPVLGRLFRSPETQITERELVIAVTPEVLGGDRTAADKSLAVEQALARTEIVAPPVDDPQLHYALSVQQRIAEGMRYPAEEQRIGMSGQVKLRVHLLKDGTLERVVLAESSGISALDQEALDATTRQSPYAPFPTELGRQDLWLELPVQFRQ